MPVLLNFSKKIWRLKKYKYLCIRFGTNPNANRDVAQLVSAPALGAGGPAFESQYPDKIKGVTKSCDSFFCIPSFSIKFVQNSFSKSTKTKKNGGGWRKNFTFS